MFFKGSNNKRNIKRIIKRSVINAHPHEKWNQFVDLIAMEDYKSLSEIQRIAHLCFWYDSEVQNGGHVQYFTNHKGKYIDETISALENINAISQREILLGVINLYKVIDFGNLKSQRDYISKVSVGYDYSFKDDSIRDDFDNYIDKYDNDYYSCSPSITDLLEKFLIENEKAFIEIVDD